MQKSAGLGWRKEAGLGQEGKGCWGCMILGFLFAFRGGFMRHVICINTVNTRFWDGLKVNNGQIRRDDECDAVGRRRG